MRPISNLFCLAILLCLVACSGKSEFIVTAKIKGLGETNVHVAYLNPEGAVDEKWVGVKEEAFQFKGETADVVLLMLSDGQGRPLARLVVEGGDEITIEGDKNKPNEFKVKGNDTSERWYEFISVHTTQYQMPDRTALNTEIEKYVKENTDDLLSTILVLVDYSGDNRDKLLAQIDEDAKPAKLLMDYNGLQAILAKQSRAPLAAMTLYASSGDFDTFSPGAAGRSLIIFWDNASGNKRKNIINTLHQADVESTNALIADIYMESDSGAWRANWKDDPIDGISHYWVPQGTMHSALKDLSIVALPTIMVIDSTGAQRYRGDDARVALQKLKN